EPIAQPNPLASHLQLTQVPSDKTSSMIKDEVKIEPSSSSSTLAKIMNGSSTSQASSQQSSQKMSSPIGSTEHSQPETTPLLQTTSAGVDGNGPTDLSVKAPAATVTRPSLTALEVAAVRQLITGYRDSADFLLRSAD
ncbi:unnamed protein product, partial [Meganyctiphanes norvegica]